ncbi:hypothetical protein SBA1_1040086 [Candidatus Sulfotelmatobacter kueseliae]|uniref:Uncharacterized protein n=1 Tax=Candidatus Sulfotelmatobacter kueseliae TaxID=2042962 RepID=A0A2U3JY88_9BACT|nr:hypothetical protein SBA1_1040086 [Candidatus Sulfotelmatobacter kueseliae]
MDIFAGTPATLRIGRWHLHAKGLRDDGGAHRLTFAGREHSYTPSGLHRTPSFSFQGKARSVFAHGRDPSSA